ncbi:MAG TPA: hypothetical protein VN618_01915 [Solirubrobacteraceae bacterium]|nr:hypothetical protein [Solirubrobacteraceae bacterium]
MAGPSPARLDVGGVIRKVREIYVDQASVLMPAAAVVFVFAGILSAVLVRSSAALGVIGELIALVAISVFTGMVVELVADVQDGRRDATPRQLLQAVGPVLGQLILVAVVVAILVALGLFLILVPGLILLTIWAVAVPVVVVEKPPGLGALARSRELVRGNGWQVFGVLVILYFLVVIISFALEAAANSAGTGAGIVAAVVVGVLTAPIPALASSVLYFELLAVRGEARTPGTPPPAPSQADPFGG